MKKFYASLVMLMMCVLAFGQAVKVTVITDNIDAMYVQDPNTYGELPWDPETKSVIVELDPQSWQTLSIVAKTGYNITSVTNQNLEQFCDYPSSRISIWSSEYNDGDVYTCTSAEKEPKSVVMQADPTMVYVTVDNTVVYNAENQVDGAWTITGLTDDSELAIVCYDGYMLSSVRDTGGSQCIWYPQDKYEFYASGLRDGVNNYVVEAYNAAEARTESCIIDVIGDPEAVTVRYNQSYADIALDGNITELPYDPIRELPLYISPKVYGNVFYKVTLNNEPVVDSYSSYSVSPANGDTIKIYTEFPDVDVPVKFTFVNEGTESSINVDVDSERVAPEVWQADDFTVKLGKKIKITYNKNAFEIVSLYNNGENTYSTYSQYEVTAVNENGYTFEVTANIIPTYDVTVKVDDPSRILAYIGNYNYYDYTAFNDTVSVVKVAQTSNAIRFTPTATGVITGVTVSTGEVVENLTDFTLYVESDMTVEFTTEEYSKPNHGMVYLAYGNSDNSYAIDGWNSMRFGTPYSSSNPHAWETVLHVGYNPFDFNNEDRPFGIDLYPDPVVYYKGEVIKLTDSWPYEYTALYDFADGDVLKIYPNQVEAHTVTNEIQEGVTVKFTTDSITNEPDNVASLSVLPGTYYTIEPVVEDDYEYTVTINDVAVEPVDGVYSTYVNEDLKVVVSAQSALKLINADNAKAQDVYNLQGIRVKAAATAEDIKALPAGLYIVGGKKYIVR